MIIKLDWTTCNLPSLLKKKSITPFYILFSYALSYKTTKSEKKQLTITRFPCLFALQRLVIGLKTRATFSINQKWNQTQSNLVPVTRSRTIFCPSHRLHVFAYSVDRFTGLSVLFVIHQCDYFAFGCKKLNWKLLYYRNVNRLVMFLRYDMFDIS